MYSQVPLMNQMGGGSFTPAHSTETHSTMQSVFSAMPFLLHCNVKKTAFGYNYQILKND